MIRAFPVESFGLSPGDVVSVDAREHWLEGAWLLEEIDLPIAAFFFASDAALGVLAAPRTDLFALAACELDIARDPPLSLEHAGTRFERARRVPVELTSFGSAPALPGRHALFLEYRALGQEALLILALGSRASAWLGTSLDWARVERWGTRV